ncbi:MAG TPA: hypothetical protein PKD55_26200 [Bellilinea sp.]|nr:hypothetical protein [Bellilinea sp.]
MDDWKNIGEGLGWGLLTAIGKALLIWITISLSIKLASNAFSWWTDDTDASGWKRSGLKLHTDHKTGVQYLSDGKNLVVRVDAEGKPVIAK